MPASGAAGAADLDQRRELGARVHFGGHAGEVCRRVDDHCFEAGASLPEDEESESSLLEGEAAGAATLGACTTRSSSARHARCSARATSASRMARARSRLEGGGEQGRTGATGAIAGTGAEAPSWTVAAAAKGLGAGAAVRSTRRPGEGPPLAA